VADTKDNKTQQTDDEKAHNIGLVSAIFCFLFRLRLHKKTKNSRHQAVTVKGNCPCIVIKTSNSRIRNNKTLFSIFFYKIFKISASTSKQRTSKPE